MATCGINLIKLKQLAAAGSIVQHRDSAAKQSKKASKQQNRGVIKRAQARAGGKHGDSNSIRHHEKYQARSEKQQRHRRSTTAKMANNQTRIKIWRRAWRKAAAANVAYAWQSVISKAKWRWYASRVIQQQRNSAHP